MPGSFGRTGREELADAGLLVVVGRADQGLADRVLVGLDVVVTLVVLADGGLADCVLVGLDVLAGLLVLADRLLLELVRHGVPSFIFFRGARFTSLDGVVG